MALVARAGDLGMVHCSAYRIVGGSTDVLANGRPVARIGDSSSVHLQPVGKKCKPHVSSIISGVNDVLVNGRPIAKVGSRLAMCTFITTGSTDVNAGF